MVNVFNCTSISNFNHIIQFMGKTIENCVVVMECETEMNLNANDTNG